MFTSTIMDSEFVENVSASLVREYLSRKNFKETLYKMDEEVPRTEQSINSRVRLAKELHIEKLLRKNKEREKPFTTMIEVLTKHFLSKTSGSKGNLSSTNQSDFHADDMPSETNESSIDMEPPPLAFTDPLVNDGEPEYESALKEDRPIMIKSNIINADDCVPSLTEMKFTSTEVSKLDTAVVEVNLPESGDQYVEVSYIEPSPTPSPFPKNSVWQSVESSVISYPFMGELEGALTHFSSELSTGASYIGEKKDSWPSPNASYSEKKVNKSPKTSNKSQSSYLSLFRKKKVDPDNGSLRDNQRRPSSSPEQRIHKSPNKITGHKMGDIEINDFDEMDYDYQQMKLQDSLPLPQLVKARGIPITIDTAVELKQLCLGSALSCFIREWGQQGFTFCDQLGLKFGFVQIKGGPCGLLASVQACVLQVLLFGDGALDLEPNLDVTEEQRTWCLATALANILWRAGEESEAVIALATGIPQFPTSVHYKPDQFTETLQLFSFTSSNTLMEFLHQYVHVFEAGASQGCILFLYSLILSRGIKKIIHEMDEPLNKLIGSHGYCTQEMVNLVLTGCAVSNVFNDDLELDSANHKSILHGIHGASNIGFLTLYEHYNSCEVGSYLKNPLYPIWVVCSESHFSVLFSLDKGLVSEKKTLDRFDLFYYDGLAQQTEIIQLTIDNSANNEISSEVDLIPPLDLCIRTKWKNALVNWNNSEPIL